MALQLCSGCRYRFPATSLSKASFTEDVGTHFDAAHQLLEKLSTSSPEVLAVAQQVQLELQELCAAVHDEYSKLQRQAAAAEEQRRSREKDLEAASARAASLHANATASSDGVTGGRAAGTRLSGALSTRQGQPQSLSAGVAAPGPGRRSAAAFDLVSASVYSILESLAIEARADTALLWIRPRGVVSVELVAPFVVGRDLSGLRLSAPYRVSETSMPVAVSSTGTAINMKPATGLRDTRATADVPLLELMDSCNVAQLLVPVFSRYGDTGTVLGGHGGTEGSPAVLAVVHLLGSPRAPFPFSARNEQAALYAATFLSSVMSAHYSAMAAEWGNHFYVPSTLSSASTFQGELDMRPDEKALDDFTPNPLLIYRCEKDCDGPTDPREASSALRSAIARGSTPMQPVLTRVRDLHRHATNMETNWVSAVETATRLEHRVGTLEDDALRDEVQALRERKEAAVAVSTTSVAATAAAMPAGSRKPRAASLLSGDVEGPLSPVSLKANTQRNSNATSVLKPEEVDLLEAVTLRRLEGLGADTTAFLAE